MSNRNIIVELKDGTRTVPDILAQIDKYRYNPSGIQRVVLDYLKAVTEGVVDIVDPTNPFVFALESSAVSTAAFMIQNEVNTRKQYPRVAQTHEDIFRHMCDKDYIDCFAMPSTCKFTILVNKEELIRKMVDVPATGIKKVTIPRNTTFTVAETIFSLQYPIDIKQYKHSGIQITYNTDKPSPLQPLKTNNIEWEARRSPDGTEWIYFEVEATQFHIKSFETPLTQAQPFRREVEIEDQFYYARVYNKRENSGEWQEIYTTHTDQVYDPLTPTAVFQVIGKKVNIYVPQIYLNNGQVDGTLRVDIYQTKGDVNLIMENYPASAFEYKWLTIDKADKNEYVAALTSINQIMVYSTQLASGGKNEIDFLTLRDRVINNTVGPQDIPITNVEITTALDKQDYQIVKNIDTVTNRIFLAAKPMPTPRDERLITAAAATMNTFITTIEAIRTHEGVYANGDRTTISPSVLYHNKSGLVTVFNKSEYDYLMSRPVDDIANYVSNKEFLYTPFHYVLDIGNNRFEVRPYYLDKPVIPTFTFVEQNDTLMVNVNTHSREIHRTSTGYKLRILTKSNSDYKSMGNDQHFCLLAFIPPGESDRAFVKGELVGTTQDNEYVYDFDLSTNYDISANNRISLTKFFMYTDEPAIVKADLTQEFEIMYFSNIATDPTWEPISTDNYKPVYLIPPTSVGLTREKVTIEFGKSLNNLWNRSRSVIESAPLKRYTVDIPWTYEEDVYQIDPVTGSKFSINAQGEVEYTILHHAGEPILDENGNPTYRYRVGDIMLDEYGKPIPEDENKVARQFDMFFIEGAYYFATDAISNIYRENVVNTVVHWITNDLAKISERLLERTHIYYYPKSSIGKIEVMVNDGTVTYMSASQSFKVTLYVNNSVYQNNDLRESLKFMTVRTFDKHLKEQTVSMSAITAELKEIYGQDVISFSTSGLGGEANYNAITVLNNEDRCSIKKRLVKLSDDKLIVQEAVDVDFVRHELNQ